MTDPTLPLPVSISDKAFAPGLSLGENLRRLHAAGFTHLHLAHKWTKPEPFTEAEEAEWTRALSDSGIRVLDSHGCHPKDVHLWSEGDDEKRLAMDLFTHRLRLTHRMGGNAMAYHVPWKETATERQIAGLLEGLRRIEDLARALGVTVALENHYLAENDQRAFAAAFGAFDADFVGFTFDPGHALISGNTAWLLEHCVSRLHILHLNDNDGREDQHWCPFDPAGQADWTAIGKFIRSSSYRKPLQLEVCWRPGHHGSHESFLAEAHAAAVRLADRG
jgi:sugar phosphate isomerase/epimerase